MCMYVRVSQILDESIQSHMICCYGCREGNSSPVQEQQVL